jgi:hypothetical protein
LAIGGADSYLFPPSFYYKDFTMEVPIPAVDIDQLPLSRGLKYDEVARIVGHLYIECQRVLSIEKEQSAAIIADLKKENAGLKKQLEIISNDRVFGGKTVSNNAGKE